jgi:two-component system sensor histidine kinase QseC
MLDRSSRWSLRRRLTLIAGGAMVTSVLVGGVAMYWAAGIESDQMLDARLEQLGAAIAAFAEHEMAEEGVDIAGAEQVETLPAPTVGASAALPHSLTTRTSAALMYQYQVWTRDGRLLMRNHEAPEDAPLAALARFGFTDRVIDGELHRVLALPFKGGDFVVQIAENHGERRATLALVTVYYAVFLLIPFGLVFGVSWLLLRRSFRAVETVAAQLGDRNPLDLSPIAIGDPPAEMVPILNSIDALFARVGQALSAERHFTSLAAHEMRTPLAGLRAQAQLAGSASDAAELREALDALRTGVDRTSHLLDQLLDLARVEALPKDRGPYRGRVSLPDLYRDVMADLEARAAARQITIATRFAAAELHGHRFALSVLLRNLLANAITYSPAGGRVEVQCIRLNDAVELTVDDAGPGIAPADRARAFERFQRLEQPQDHGVGLGLSIALSVAELHGARIELLPSPLGGLRVRVLFPAASDAT